MVNERLHVLPVGDVWQLSGLSAGRFAVVNEFLGHLADRNYSPRTQRAYAFDLLAFGRWLDGEGVALGEVDTDVLLRFLTACREAVLPGRPGGNVYSIRDGRSAGYAPSTINRRLAAISALFVFWQMRDPMVVNPVPRGRQGRSMSRGKRSGLLAHVGKPAARSRLRLRELRRLPQALSREESTLLLGSFRTWRDRAIAGLMLMSGLRSCEVLGLQVADVDSARRWARVVGKGEKERRVPIDHDVACVSSSDLAPLICTNFGPGHGLGCRLRWWQGARRVGGRCRVLRRHVAGPGWRVAGCG